MRSYRLFYPLFGLGDKVREHGKIELCYERGGICDDIDNGGEKEQRQNEGAEGRWQQSSWKLIQKIAMHLVCS